MVYFYRDNSRQSYEKKMLIEQLSKGLVVISWGLPTHFVNEQLKPKEVKWPSVTHLVACLLNKNPVIFLLLSGNFIWFDNVSYTGQPPDLMAYITCRDHRQILTEIYRDLSEFREVCSTLSLTYVKAQLRTQNWLSQTWESRKWICIEFTINLVLQASGAAWDPFIPCSQGLVNISILSDYRGLYVPRLIILALYGC